MYFSYLGNFLVLNILEMPLDKRNANIANGT